MRAVNQKGFGLILMIILIALSMVMIGPIASFLSSASNLSMVRINKTKSYYLALGGIAQALQTWTTSYTALVDENTATGYRSARWPSTGGTEYADTGDKSDFAYFMMDGPSFNAQWWPLTSPLVPSQDIYPDFPANNSAGYPNAFCESNKVGSGNNYNYRLYGWTVKSIHKPTGNSSVDNLLLSGITVRWSPPGHSSLRVSEVRLNDRTVFAGAAQNGVYFSLNRGNALLNPIGGPGGGPWSGPCTYLQWNGAVPDPVRVTVQLRFSEGSTSSTTHEALFWDGRLAGDGRPHIHTFSVTSIGQVNQTFGGARTKLRATIGNAFPGDRHTMRVLSLENLDQ